MGFYSGQSLVADARRHGVQVLRPDILRSGVGSGLERSGPVPSNPEPSNPEPGSVAEPAAARPSTGPGDGAHDCLEREQPPVPQTFDRSIRLDYAAHRRDDGFAVRLGLDEVKGIGTPLAERIVAERERGGDYQTMADLVRRVGVTAAQLEFLAAAGAFDSLGLTQREALWSAGSAAADRAEFLPGSTVTVQPPLFSMPSEAEQLSSDLWATGISTNDHPMRHIRHQLDARGVYSAVALHSAENGRRIEVAGVVTHRQRPATASGITFVNLEDETGLVNVICSVGVWNRYRRVARDAAAMVVRGILERSSEGVINLVADRIEALTTGQQTSSRDFR